eukprot:2512779-Pyramimonas_sp.AAC.1
MLEGGSFQHALGSAWHLDRTYQPGDWVYIWRRAPKTGRKPNGLGRDRWVGPGPVARVSPRHLSAGTRVGSSAE